MESVKMELSKEEILLLITGLIKLQLTRGVVDVRIANLLGKLSVEATNID